MGIGIFRLNLAANESREAAITGEYFELRNAVHPVLLIELLDKSGGVIARLDNPEQSDFVRPGRYETVRITNGPVAQTVKHFYGTGDAGSRRTSGLVQVDGTVTVMGNVSMIDGEKSRTLAGGMYAGAPGVAAVGGQYSYVQLWNPVGSGKNLIVMQAGCSAGAAMACFLYIRQTMMPTNQTANRAANKLAGAPMGVGQVRGNNDAAIETYPFGMLHAMSFNNLDTRPWPIRGAIVVPPGFSLNCTTAQVNIQLGANFEWFEEPA